MATLLSAFLTLSSAQADDTAPDLIVVNADIHTADPAQPRASAMAIRDGRFMAVGKTPEILRLAGPKTRVISVDGRSVTPGFIDGHSHMGGNAPRVAGVDLSYIVDKSDWLKEIAAAHQRLPAGEWLTGGYWDHTLSDGIYPDRAMLDAITPDRPVFLTHIDGHYAWVNSKALALAGVTANSTVPPGGEIVLDPRTGEPTGILLEGAMGLVGRVIPERNVTQRRAGLAEMQRFANSVGISGLHQMGDLDDYLHLVEESTPSLRIWYGESGSRATAANARSVAETIHRRQTEVDQRISKSGKTKSLGPLLALGYVKLINDGVLSARTAVMLADYNDQADWRGEYITSPAELAVKVREFNAAGLPVAIHSIGDAAVRASLDAFEASSDMRPRLPNRIEHIEVVTPQDVKRFKEFGVVASMQPNHCTNAIGYVPSRLGPQRASDAYVWRSMLAAQVPLVFGADYPTSPLDPLTQIADALFRVSPFGFADGKPWFPQQALSFDEALFAYTQAPANMTTWGNEIGSITEGKWADFVVLSGSVPEPMTPAFRELRVQATFFAGREVYSAIGR